MAADLKIKYGTSNQTLTITVASLANNGARESTAVDNTTNVFLDALVTAKIKSGASSTSTTGRVEIWAYGTTDGGTTYGDLCTGVDAAHTMTVPSNLQLLGILNVVANATTYESNPLSVASAFGGVLPQKWGVVVVNLSGGTLDSTGGNHFVVYQGVYGQSV